MLSTTEINESNAIIVSFFCNTLKIITLTQTYKREGNLSSFNFVNEVTFTSVNFSCNLYPEIRNSPATN